MDIQELKTKMQQAQRAEKTVDICLRGDLQAEWDALNDTRTQLKRSGPDSLGDGRVAEIENQMDAIADQMRESTIQLRFRALPRKDWFGLLEKHPPREGNSQDRALGLNQDSFFDDLIPRSLVDPELDKDTLSELLDLISGADYQNITLAVFSINQHEVSVPFSLSGSRATSSSGATSKPQPKRASRSGGGTAGSRKSTRSTSTTKKAD